MFVVLDVGLFVCLLRLCWFVPCWFMLVLLGFALMYCDGCVALCLRCYWFVSLCFSLVGVLRVCVWLCVGVCCFFVVSVFGFVLAGHALPCSVFCLFYVCTVCAVVFGVVLSCCVCGVCICFVVCMMFGML